MRVLLTGGTGFIGRRLVRALVDRGDECTVISRGGHDPWQSPAVEIVVADPVMPGHWQSQVARADAVVNLAGERIFDPRKRWTTKRKKTLAASRVTVTRNLVDAIRGAQRRPKLFLSGSAIGYYGPSADREVDESSPAGSDFLARLAVDWENAALEAADLIPVCLLRTGIVLGRGGGALAPLLTLFKTGLGGPWGHGRQWWSWIHMEDHVGITLFALDRPLTGPVNLTAPNPVTVNEFARDLGRSLRRPALLRAPAFALRLALGEAASALIDLQRVLPATATEAGYSFSFPSIGGALQDLVGDNQA